MLQRAGVEVVLDAQPDDVEQPLVAHVCRAHAGLVQVARAAILQIRVRRDQPRRRAALPRMIERRPRVDIPVLRAGALLTRLLPRDDRVARHQRFERGLRVLAELVVHASEAVGVLRLAEVVLAQVREIADVAATAGEQRVPAPAGELRGRERARVEQIEPDLEVARVHGPHGRRVDDRAHAIAVLDREAARVELEAVDQPRVEQAHRAQEVLQMERLVQAQAVEHDRRLVRLAAAHRADAREAVGGRAGQALHGAQRLVGEARHVLHLLLREERARRDFVAREPVSAGLDDDFFEPPGGGLGRGIGGGRRRAGDDCEHTRRNRRQRQAARGEDLARQLHAVLCLRLSLDPQVARQNPRVVDEGETRRAQLVQHVADAPSAQLLRRGWGCQQRAHQEPAGEP